MNNNKKNIRLEEEQLNNQGCLMKIIEYKNTNDIIVEFQDEYKARVHTEYKHFTKGNIKNPYYPSVYRVGIIGNKYLVWMNGKSTKEYEAWKQMLRRCYDKNLKEKHPTYKDTTCCKEWLLFENFYEWLHSQENFDKWFNNNDWDLDKDILIKGNKIYSPETCCLVPHSVNSLFTNHNLCRGNLPVGITKNTKGFCVRCLNPITNEREYIGTYLIIEKAFQAYKVHKEDIIKQVAEIEYNVGNITKECCKAMMAYEVEITD